MIIMIIMMVLFGLAGLYLISNAVCSAISQKRDRELQKFESSASYNKYFPWQEIEFNTAEEKAERDRLKKRRDDYDRRTSFFTNDTIGAICATTTLIVGFALICCTIGIGVEHSDWHINKELAKYDAVQINVNEYSSITIKEYNDEIIDYKYAYENPWFSWFHAEELAKREVINIGAARTTPTESE